MDQRGEVESRCALAQHSVTKQTRPRPARAAHSTAVHNKQAGKTATAHAPQLPQHVFLPVRSRQRPLRHVRPLQQYALVHLPVHRPQLRGVVALPVGRLPLPHPQLHARQRGGQHGRLDREARGGAARGGQRLAAVLVPLPPHRGARVVRQRGLGLGAKRGVDRGVAVGRFFGGFQRHGALCLAVAQRLRVRVARRSVALPASRFHEAAAQK